jgi:hypothetical protein
MQRAVRKRSVVRKVQAGGYGLRLAVVDRWPLFGGGRYGRFDCNSIALNSKMLTLRLKNITSTL